MNMTTLTPREKQKLKAKAHKLKPIVFIGNNGLTENVKKEINNALDAHELIKIKIRSADREERQQLFDEVCQHASAEGLQLIGNIGVIYRMSEEK